MGTTAQYADGKMAKVGDVVLKRRQGSFGNEKFLVVSTKVDSSFVGVQIIGNNRLMNFAESVPAGDLWPIGVAEIKIADE